MWEGGRGQGEAGRGREKEKGTKEGDGIQVFANVAFITVDLPRSHIIVSG